MFLSPFTQSENMLAQDNLSIIIYSIAIDYNIIAMSSGSPGIQLMTVQP